jgi:CheY-like chemotaxis protein
MPGLTGFELCEKLRALPQHAKTPVIFVTAFNNFENRKQSVLSGGGDLIAKPVSPLELALKVTIHLLKAPPKPVAVPANDGPAPALVWKEPSEVISHDTVMFLRGVKDLNSAPNLDEATTETRTTDPDTEIAEPVAKEPEPIKMREEILEPTAALVPAGSALAELGAKTIEANVLESVAKAHSVTTEPPAIKMPAISLPVEPAAPIFTSPQPVEPVAKTPEPMKEITPVARTAETVAKAPAVAADTGELVAKAFEPARVSEPVKSKILESEPAAPSLSNERTVVPTQPPQSSEPVLPAPNGSSKHIEPMNKENNPQFETLVHDVAQIIFGDNAPDINVRLVRMALEQVWKNRSELQSLDAVAREIARIIFGESNTSDLNVRLVKMALERSNSIALFKAA